MHVNYIIISTEKIKYNVTVNKTYNYNVVIAGILSMVIWISYYILLGGGKINILHGTERVNLQIIIWFNNR